MADNKDIPQYPFMFSPDQWLNKFSPFQGKPIPFPAQYQGVPTDALGNPIQSYLDAQSQAAAAAAAPPPAQASPVTLNTNPMEMRNAALTGQPGAAMAYGANFAPQGSPPGIQQMYGQNFAAFTPTRNWSANAPAAAPPARPAGPDMNAAYLAALSNPGKVTTGGATVPQSAPPSNQSGVLQQFLQNWKPGASAAGNYDPGLFVNALRGQV
jgi:hypothetical protein